MHRIRHTVQLVILMTCLIWGGLQTSASVLALTNESNASYAQSDNELQTQYPGLPIEVARSIRSVVATQRIADEATGQGSVASGVIINGQQILTAGHVVERDGSVACSNTSVVTAGLVTSATISNDPVTHVSVKHDKTTDVAVLTLRASSNFGGLPDVKISDNQLTVGETVYFINYQPTADGKVRSPASTDVASTTPVVFSGTVVKDAAGRTTIATGNGKSFGAGASDNLVRKGASGGAIVNSRGELVGLSVASESLTADHSAASIKKEFGVSLSANSTYQIAYMQPISQGLVKGLQSMTVSC